MDKSSPAFTGRFSTTISDKGFGEIAISFSLAAETDGSTLFCFFLKAFIKTYFIHTKKYIRLANKTLIFSLLILLNIVKYKPCFISNYRLLIIMAVLSLINQCYYYSDKTNYKTYLPLLLQ